MINDEILNIVFIIYEYFTHILCKFTRKISNIENLHDLYVFFYMRSKKSTFKAGNANTCFDVTTVTLLVISQEQTGILHFYFKMM
jgi:hypothetical protein